MRPVAESSIVNHCSTTIPNNASLDNMSSEDGKPKKLRRTKAHLAKLTKKELDEERRKKKTEFQRRHRLNVKQEHDAIQAQLQDTKSKLEQLRKELKKSKETIIDVEDSQKCMKKNLVAQIGRLREEKLQLEDENLRLNESSKANNRIIDELQQTVAKLLEDKRRQTDQVNDCETRKRQTHQVNDWETRR